MTLFRKQPVLWLIFTALILTAISWDACAVSLETLLEYRTPGDVQVSPDGKQAVFTVTSSDLESNAVRANLWIVDISSGHAFQLTKAKEKAAALAWSPDGDRIAFLTDRTGTRQIWTISPSGGEAEPALPGESRNIMQYRWLPGGDGFLFLTAEAPAGAPGPGRMRMDTEKSPREAIWVDATAPHARLFKYGPDAKVPKSLTSEDYHVRAFDVSADGGQAVFTSQSGPAPPYSVSVELNILDLGSGQSRNLITQRAPIISPKFSPDGKWIAFVSQLELEDGSYNVLNNQYLQLVSVNGEGQKNLSLSIDQDVLGFEWSGNSKTMFFWVDEHVFSKLYRVRLATAIPELLSAFAERKTLQRGEGVSFSPDGQIGVAAISDAASPSELYAFGQTGRTLRKLTDLNQHFAEIAPQTEVLEYSGSDGLPLEALVVKPRDYTPGKRYPLLVIVHGGPPGVFPYAFIPRMGVYPIFAFADAGYTVLLPNPRGSTGYGEKFRKANFKDLGGGDFRDIMAGVDVLIESGIADSTRLGLMGWSYGGFMAYWTVTHTTRFKAVSAGAGITNLTSHHGTGEAKGYGQHDSIWQAVPWEEPQLYIDHSPLFFIENAKTPLLIQHGAADTIVPVSQAQEFYSAAKRVGLPVEFVIYPGQPHVIQAPMLVLDGMQRNLDWFNKWLLKQQD